MTTPSGEDDGVAPPPIVDWARLKARLRSLLRSYAGKAVAGIFAVLVAVVAGIFVVRYEHCRLLSASCPPPQPTPTLTTEAAAEDPFIPASPTESPTIGDTSSPSEPPAPTSGPEIVVPFIDWELPPDQTCIGARYVITGQLAEVPPPGTTVWIITRVLDDPDLTGERPLNFAKRQLADPSTAGFRETIEMQGGNAGQAGHRRIFLLVTATADAHLELDQNYRSDLAQDGSFSDVDREQLPPGVRELAVTGEAVGNCP